MDDEAITPRDFRNYGRQCFLKESLYKPNASVIAGWSDPIRIEVPAGINMHEVAPVLGQANEGIETEKSALGLPVDFGHRKNGLAFIGPELKIGLGSRSSFNNRPVKLNAISADLRFAPFFPNPSPEPGRAYQNIEFCRVGRAEEDALAEPRYPAWNKHAPEKAVGATLGLLHAAFLVGIQFSPNCTPRDAAPTGPKVAHPFVGNEP